jgi:hypothetical protein
MKHKYLQIMRAVSPHPQLDFLIRKGRQGGRKYRLQIFIGAFALATLAGLGAVVADPSVTAFAGSAAGAAFGTYQISCFTTAPTPEPCLPSPTANSFETPVDTAVLLDAHVTDSSGNLATSGSWIFQDCLLKGVPAPSSACDSGSGLWSNIQEVHFRPDPAHPLKTDIRVAYGIVSAPQTIGFRFRYLGGHASGIANGISNSMDVTWF